MENNISPLDNITFTTVGEKFIVWIRKYKYLQKRSRIWSSAHGSAFTTLVMNPNSGEYFSLVKCSDVHVLRLFWPVPPLRYEIGRE